MTSKVHKYFLIEDNCTALPGNDSGDEAETQQLAAGTALPDSDSEPLSGDSADDSNSLVRTS